MNPERQAEGPGDEGGVEQRQATPERVSELTVQVVGGFDVYTASSFRQKIWAALEKANEVCLDLSQCTYIDGSGLTLLCTAWKESRRQDQRFYVLETLPSQVEKALKLTGLWRILPIRPSHTPTTSERDKTVLKPGLVAPPTPIE